MTMKYEVNLCHLMEKTPLDTNKFHSIEIILPSGGRINIDLFQRKPGFISVRTLDNSMMVYPAASNAVEIGEESDGGK